MTHPAASPGSTRLLFAAGAVLLLGFLALGWIGSSEGIGSLDANGIIYIVNRNIDLGAVEVSRPPGHPLSENWILPVLGRVISFGHDLSPFAYGLYQLTGGLFCLACFWLLLDALAVPLARRILAVACLAFSPQFLTTSSDGEEFLWGMGFVFIAVLIVAKLSEGTFRFPFAGWCFAVACAVAASGYRVEYGAMALLVIFATLLVSDQTWPRRLALAGLAAVLFLLLWTPVLLHQGVAAPFANPLSLATRLAVGAYKIAFHAIGIIPILIGLVILFQSRHKLRVLPPFGQSNLSYWSLWLVVGFFALFFVYPTKILVVLPGVAFLILLGAAYAGRWTWACFVVACMSVLLLHIDCFQDRKFVGIKIQPSMWAQNLGDKPAALGPDVNVASLLATTGRHVVISTVWPWGLAWQKDHAGWPGAPDPGADFEGWHEAYHLGSGIVTARSIVDDRPSALKAYVQQGYDVWYDRDLYRQMYMRYNLSAPAPETADVNGVTCRIVEMK